MTATISARPTRATLVKAGAGAAAAAAGLIAYGAYGDPSAPDNQKSAVPFLIGIAVVVSAIVFGLLVPRALRAIEAGAQTAARWCLGHGIASVVLLIVFWSGVTLIVGAAAVLLAAVGRRQCTGRATPYSVALWLAGSAIAATVVWTVLTNTVLSN